MASLTILGQLGVIFYVKSALPSSCGSYLSVVSMVLIIASVIASSHYDKKKAEKKLN